MKRGHWDRRTYKIAIFISTIVMIVLNKLFVIMPIVDIDWSDWWYPFTLFLLFLLLPTICCIGWALKNSRPGDVIVLCGKGHETYQEVCGEKRHMDERELVAAYTNG